MPSWKKIDIWMDHIRSGHKHGGWRTGCNNHKKTLFPENMTDQQIEKAIRQAYRSAKKVQSQDKTVVMIGEYEGGKIKMYVNKEKKLIETAYPIK